MADDIQIVQQAPKTWKERGIDWFFAQGTSVMILLAGVGFLGWQQFKQQPERDAAWAKIVEGLQTQNAKNLEDRDKRFIEYRTKADEKTAETVKVLVASHEKNLDRWIQVLTEKINDVKAHSERTAQKVESLTQ